VAYLNVIFLKKVYDSDVVFECHLMSLGEDFQVWHVASIRLDCFENIFRQTDGIQLEISLKQQVDDIVNTPLPGFFERCSGDLLVQSLPELQIHH
jgi:hypothetical protein